MKCSRKLLAVPAFAALMLVVAPMAMSAPASADVGVGVNGSRCTSEIVNGVIVSNTAACCSGFFEGWFRDRWLGWDGSTWFARDGDRWVGWNGDRWLEGDGDHWFAWDGNHWFAWNLWWSGFFGDDCTHSLSSLSDLIGGAPVIPVIPLG